MTSDIVRGMTNELVQRARELAPMLRANGARIEADRTLGPEVAGALAKAGLFRMAVPRSVGGPEHSPREIIEAIEAVSIADAAAGWCVGIGATTSLVAGYLPIESARTMFADPMHAACGVFAPMGKGVRESGGVRVKGRWSFASGVDHSEWRLVGFVTDDGAMLQGIVRREETRIVDTWSAAGLRGTGSHDMVIEDAFIPDAFTLSLAGSPRETGPLYRFPVFGLLALSIAAVTLGVGRAALDAFAELAKTKKQAGSTRTLAERETIQTDLARAEGSLRAGRMLVLATIDEVFVRAQAGDPLSLADRAALRLAATHASERAAAAIDAVQRMAGSASVYDAQPFGRFHRDVHVATQHLMVSDTTYTMCGRAMLGLPVQEAAF
jgi:alkylation response protein AidB-like acyl-CoA dehydrogenase